MVGWLANLRLQ